MKIKINDEARFILNNRNIRLYNTLLNEDKEIRVDNSFLFDLVNNKGSNFTCILIRLIQKADRNNIQKLFKGFPAETIITLLYYNSDHYYNLLNKKS